MDERERAALFILEPDEHVSSWNTQTTHTYMYVYYVAVSFLPRLQKICTEIHLDLRCEFFASYCRSNATYCMFLLFFDTLQPLKSLRKGHMQWVINFEAYWGSCPCCLTVACCSECRVFRRRVGATAARLSCFFYSLHIQPLPSSHITWLGVWLWECQGFFVVH